MESNLPMMDSSESEQPRSRASKILERTGVGLGLAAAVAVLLWIAHATRSSSLVLGIGALLAWFSAGEAARLVDRILSVDPEAESGSLARVPLLGAVVLATVVLAAVRHNELAFFGGPAADESWRALALFGLVQMSALAAAMLFSRRPWRGLVFGAAVWSVPPLVSLVLVWDSLGAPGLVSLVVLSKFGDVTGYYGGNAFGRSHPFPKLSPGKTTEGCTASLAGSLFMAWFLTVVGLLELAVLPALALGAALNLTAQAGDLLESWFKRRAAIKDSGTLFGPSGGALDVVDSLLLTVPTLLILAPLLFG